MLKVKEVVKRSKKIFLRKIRNIKNFGPKTAVKWVMLLTILIPSLLGPTNSIVYARSDIELREAFRDHNIEQREIVTNPVRGPQRETMSQRPTHINVRGRRVEGFEVLSKRSENSKTFYIPGSEDMVTEIYFEPMHKYIQGFYVDIDNNLEVSEFGHTNTLGLFDVNFYNEHGRYSITYDNHTLIFSYPDMNLSNYKIENNQVFFTGIEDGVDLELIIGNSTLKENIFFNGPVESNTFTYQVNHEGLQVRREVDNNYLCFYVESENNTCIFEIYAPFMRDADGNINLSVEISYEEIDEYNTTIILTFDYEWVNAYDRVYPVLLDPIVVPLLQGSISVDSSHIRSNQPTVTARYEHLFVGYDLRAFASQTVFGLGHTESFITFPMPNIGNDRTVENAILELNKNTQMIFANHNISVHKTNTFVSPFTVNWNNRPTTNVRLVSNNTVSQGLGWQQLDITSFVQELNDGTQNTLVLRPTVQNTNLYPVVFDSEHTGNMPRIIITHRASWDVDPDLDINTFDNVLRVFSRGLNGYEAVSLEGIARPNSTVVFRLFRREEDGTKTFIRDLYSRGQSSLNFIDPVWITDPINGVQQYIRENINYTSYYHRRDVHPSYDTRYGYNIVVRQGANESTRYFETDEFLFYEVKLGDNLNRIASTFGVTIPDIKRDNNLTNGVVQEGDVLFIRFAKDNPRLTPDQFTPRSVVSTFQAEFRALGPNCGFACRAANPVNLFTGNTFAEFNDVTIRDFTDVTLTRVHNSRSENFVGMFGRKFAFNYDRQIAFDRDGNMLFFRGDGGILQFERDGNNFISIDQDYYTITRVGNNIHIFNETDRVTMVFNEYGVMIYERHPNGQFIRFIYDEIGRLVTMNINDSRQIQFEHNAFHLVEAIVLPNGNRLHFEYNANRELLRFTDEAGYSETYYYDDDSRITQIRDRNGNLVSQNEFDNDGRVSIQTDPYGRDFIFNYYNGRTSVTNDGRTWNVECDEFFRMTKEQFPGGTYVRAEYDDRNNLIREINELGQTRTFEYDANDNIIKRADFDGTIEIFAFDERSNKTKSIDRLGNINEFGWDGNNNLAWFRDERGNVTTYVYNARSERVSQTDHLGNTTTFTHDRGRVASINHPNGLIENFFYDVIGNLIRHTDNMGRNHIYVYDERNNLIRETDSLGQVEEFMFDGNGNMTHHINKSGGLTRKYYDALNRVIREQTGNRFVQFTHDMNGNVLTATNELNQTTTFYRDRKGRVIRETDHLGNSKHFQYDDADNKIYERDEFGVVTTFVHNDKGQVIERSIDGVTETYEYDRFGNITKTTFDNGTYETSTFNELGLLVGTKDTRGNVTTYVHDENRNVIVETRVTSNGTYTINNTFVNNLLVESVDSEGLVTTYTHSPTGLVTSTTWSDGRSLVFEYDLYGNVIRETNEDGYSRTFTYDLLGRRTSESDFLGNVTTFAYDGLDNVIRETDSNGNSELRVYNAFGDLLQETNRRGHQTTYHYNDVGLKIRETDAYGIDTEYIYNDLHQLIKMVREDQVIAEFAFDQYGRTIKERIFNETVEFRYDKFSNVTRETHSNGIIINFTFDRYGNQVRERDNFNTDNRHVYDRYHRRVRTTDKSGNVRTITYDSLNNVVEAKDFFGIVIRNRYDAYNRLIETREGPSTTRFEHDGYNRVISQNVNGNITRFVYNPLNQVIETIDPLGNSSFTTYDFAGNVLSETDRNGNTTEFEYDEDFNKILERNARGHERHIEYDIYDNVIRETDFRGGGTQFKFNSLGQLLERRDRNGFSTYHRWNDNFQLVEITHPYGYRERIEYDRHGHISRVIHKNGASTRLRHDLGGNVIWQQDPNGNVTTFRFDNYENKVEERLPNGNRIIHEYNDRNLLFRVRHEYNTRNLFRLRTTSYTVEEHHYDRYNRLVRSLDGNRNETRFTHDRNSNVITKVCTLRTIVFAYDRNNNLTSELINNQVRIRYIHDNEGNVLRTYRNNHLMEENVFDEVGNLISETDKHGVVVERDFDENENVIRVRVNGQLIYTYEYDVSDNVTLIRDVYNTVTRFTYDAYDNKTSETNGNGFTTRFEYDSMGNMSAVRDHEGNIVRFSYDNNNNLISRSAGQSREIYWYDSVNNKIRMRDQYGHTTEFRHDMRGNVIKETQPNRNVVEFEWDGNNNRTLKTSRNIRITTTYNSDNLPITIRENNQLKTIERDAFSNVIRVTDPNGRATSYTYDLLGNRTSITYSSGRVVEYIFNARNLVSEIKENGQTIITYQHNSLGQETHISRSNGVRTYQRFDTLGRRTYIANFNNALISRHEFVYDGLDNVTLETITRNNQTTRKAYTFNFRDELIRERINGEIITHSFDMLGNRREVSSTRGSTTHIHENGLLTTIIEPSGRTIFRHDDNGNLIEERKNNRVTMRYQYDALNRLVRTENPRYIVEYSYIDSERIGKTTTDIIARSIEHDRVDRLRITNLDEILDEQELERGFDRLRYQLNGRTCADVYPDEGAYRQRLTFVNDITREHTEVLEIYRGNRLQQTEIYNDERIKTNDNFYLSMRNGTIEMITNPNGQVISHFTYNSYGLSNNQRGFGFNGEHRDVNGLIYLRFRYYNPRLKRFINKDSWKGEQGRPLSHNQFIFVENNPIKYTDPSGHFVITGTLVLGGLALLLITSPSTVPMMQNAIGGIGGNIAGTNISRDTTTLLDRTRIIPRIDTSLPLREQLGRTGIAPIPMPRAIPRVCPVPTPAPRVIPRVETRPAPPPKNTTRNHLVYALVNGLRLVQYIGRTSNFSSTVSRHRANPFRTTFHVEKLRGGLTYSGSRFVEQAMIMFCGTLNPNNLANNLRNSINLAAPKNARYLNAMNEMQFLRERPAAGTVHVALARSVALSMFVPF